MARPGFKTFEEGTSYLPTYKVPYLLGICQSNESIMLSQPASSFFSSHSSSLDIPKVRYIYIHRMMLLQ